MVIGLEYVIIEKTRKGAEYSYSAFLITGKGSIPVINSCRQLY